jgi:ABC-type Fe3+-hydroxamate transport system substrate-binding protein
MRAALRFISIAITAVVLVAGCKNDPSAAVPEGGKIGGVTLDSPARYIISLSPSATEVLALNGASRDLIGRTASCNYPSFVQKIRVVMSGTKPDYEIIGRLLQTPEKQPVKPDLFVYDPALFNDADVAMMAQNSRIKPFALDGDTLDEFIVELKNLSKLYTGETFMSEYIDKIVSARKASLADPVTPTPSVALILPGQGSEHMIAGKDSFFADEIRAATGNPVGPPGKTFVILNPESLIQMNPDIIITAGDADTFIKDPRFQTLSAIKNNRVQGTNQDATVRRGGRVPEVISQFHGTFAELMSHGASK